MMSPSARNPTRKPPTKQAQKREELRNQLWPDSASKVWSRHENMGFTTIPRLLPLVMHLIKILARKGDPSAVYFELWTRAFDEGLATILDDDACAYCSGYTGTRATRTWREHILQLQELGFIRVKPQGNREVAYILILDPVVVCTELHNRRNTSVPEEWWNAFVQRASDIGCKLPGGGET